MNETENETESRINETENNDIDESVQQFYNNCTLHNNSE